MTSKIPVAILGATGSVGQRMVSLLADHPNFYIVQLAASEKSQGKTYAEAVHWLLDTPIPKGIGSMIVTTPVLQSDAKIALSALDTEIARLVEPEWAKKGVSVVSNASAYRMDEDVPLVIPEVNANHLQVLSTKNKFSGGCIVTNPNCVVIGLCLALKPLVDRFGVADISVTTFQSVSGAGFPGVASLSILDNLIPYIGNEEQKVETEPKKIFGTVQGGRIVHDTKMNISASCVRVPVSEGHLKSVSVRFQQKPNPEDIVNAWESFSPSIQHLNLPSAPSKAIFYHSAHDFPQPKLHRLYGKGMAVSVGRLRPCSLFDYKFMVLSHNTLRGAAGGALLLAELLISTKK